MALKAYKAEVGRSGTTGQMRNNHQIREQNQGRSRGHGGFGQFRRDFRHSQGGGRGYSGRGRDSIVEEVEVIPEEANFNRFLELLMDLDSSISEIDSGLNTTHLLPTHHIYSTSSLEKSKRY